MRNSNLSIDLDVNDQCMIEVWCEKELKCFKTYTKRCTAKVIPDWWNKRVLSLLKRVSPTRQYIGDVDLFKVEIYNSIGIGFKADK